MALATFAPDRPAADWTAEWSMLHGGPDTDLVATTVFEDYLNLLALEEALAARRGDDWDFLDTACVTA